MPKPIVIYRLGAFALATLLFACASSSGGGGGDSIDASDPSSLTTTFGAIEGLLKSLEEEDTESSGSSAKLLATRAQSSLPDELRAAKFSMTGCQVKEQFRRAKNFGFNEANTLCRIDAVTKAAGVTLSEDYQVIRITGIPVGGPDNPEETGTMLARVKTQAGKKLELQLCQKKGDEALQMQSWRAEKLEDGEGIEVALQQNNPGENRTSSLVLKAKGKEDEIDEVSMDSRWVEGNDKGSVTTYANRADKLIQTSGSFDNSFDGPNGTYMADFEMCGFISKGRGAGQFEGTFTRPPYDSENFGPICGFENQAAEGEIPNFQPVYAENGVCVDSTDGPQQEAFRNFVISDGTSSFGFCAIDDSEESEALKAKLSECEAQAEPLAPDAFEVEWNCDDTEATEVAFEDIDGFAECEEERDDSFVDCHEMQKEVNEQQKE